MANEIRRRFNFQSGTISGAVLSGATSFSSANLAGFSAISNTEHAVVVLSPNGTTAEIVYVTGHVASSTAATIVRAREGSSAVEHAHGNTWIHAPAVSDYVRTVDDTASLPSTGGLPYEGLIVYQLDVNSIKVYSDSAWCEIGPVSQWTAWAPTITQSSSITYTNSYGRYMRIGRTIIAQFRFLITGTGSAGSRLYVATPTSRAYTTAEQVVGDFQYTDTSSGAVYRGQILTDPSNERLAFKHMPTGNFLGDGESFATGNTDVFTGTFMYEAAS